MEITFVLIKWETTRNIDYIDLKDLKHFSMDNPAPRKQKSTDFYTPLSGKKMQQLSNVKITDLICNIAQKICSIQRRTLLYCALKVRLGT
jgi:hypothetical protein